MAANRPRPLRAALAGAAALLALSACAAPAEPPADPHAGVDTGAAVPPGASSGGSPSGTPASDRGGSPRAQAAVDAGIRAAAALGFGLAAPAASEDLKALRDAPADALEGVVVAPSTCRAVVEELSWAPGQQSGDAARTDFTTEGASVTGTVEVAPIEDRAALDAHYATVERMLGECSRLTLNIQQETANGGVVPETVPLTSTAPEVPAADVDSALLWTRGRDGQALQQQALVLMGERAGHVAMVSFIGPEGLDDGRFAAMASGILDATLAAAEG